MGRLNYKGDLHIVGLNNTPPSQDGPRINELIRADSVRCIGADGEQLGVIPINEALKLAENLSLDLVEIQPNVDPPVCKILDYGDKVKITLRFRGREMAHHTLGATILDRVK